MGIPSQNTKYTRIFTRITKHTNIPSQNTKYTRIYTGLQNLGHSIAEETGMPTRIKKTYAHFVTEYKIYENIYTDCKTYGHSVTEYKI